MFIWFSTSAPKSIWYRAEFDVSEEELHALEARLVGTIYHYKDDDDDELFEEAPYDRSLFTYSTETLSIILGKKPIGKTIKIKTSIEKLREENVLLKKKLDSLEGENSRLRTDVINFQNENDELIKALKEDDMLDYKQPKLLN